MAQGYLKKDELRLRWDEAKRRLRMEGRFFMDRVLNEVIAAADEEFQLQETRGEMPEVPDRVEEIRDYVRAGIAKVISKEKEAQRVLPSKR